MLSRCVNALEKVQIRYTSPDPIGSFAGVVMEAFVCKLITHIYKGDRNHLCFIVAYCSLPVVDDAMCCLHSLYNCLMN